MSQETNIDPQAQRDSVLQQMQVAGECTTIITEVLFILNGKRETLEEKSIKRIFHELAIANSRFVATLHEICLSKGLPDATMIENSAKLFDEIRLSVSELLKICRYDLNFLEQYFEYEYCARLHDELRFVERVEQLHNEFAVMLAATSS